MLLLQQQFSTFGSWRKYYHYRFCRPESKCPKMGRGTPVEKLCFIELDCYRCIFKIIIFFAAMFRGKTFLTFLIFLEKQFSTSDIDSQIKVTFREEEGFAKSQILYILKIHRKFQGSFFYREQVYFQNVKIEQKHQ